MQLRLTALFVFCLAVSSTTSSSPSCSSSFNHSLSSQASFKVTSTVMSTPTECARRSRNPKKWSIEDVISYVREKEPALHPHLFVFQRHVSISSRCFLFFFCWNCGILDTLSLRSKRFGTTIGFKKSVKYHADVWRSCIAWILIDILVIFTDYFQVNSIFRFRCFEFSYYLVWCCFRHCYLLAWRTDTIAWY